MDIVDGNLYAAMRIILPEHRAEMRRMEQLSKARTKPILSQESLAEMTYTITEAIQDERSVRIELFATFENEIIEGSPTILNGKLQVVTSDGIKHTLSPDRIVSVSII
ncbi:YolD-like family protein [Alicyclobacillus fodiniaquatilis]|uniref:YolD-like family protein n=1 Tax=Alicyclobacillus fodiniaquatilis TaxID=1661150 RepID=A0ABW4JHM5_9BACL